MNKSAVFISDLLSLVEFNWETSLFSESIGV